MNKDKIYSVLKELNNISSFRISLHTTEFNEIAAYPERKQAFCEFIQKNSENELLQCKQCDREACQRALIIGDTVIYKCRHGLVEAISPLYNFDVLTGFLMMGQVICDGDSTVAAQNVLQNLGMNCTEAKNLAGGIPVIDGGKLSSFVNIMTVCASYLTLSNAITGAKSSVARLARQYISEHFTERISISDICAAVGYSKSSVLSAFKKEFSVTVNTYLNELRLERARKLLENGNFTVNEIALSCGFSDQSYFSKVFSAKYGKSPTSYRKDEAQ